MFKAGLFLTVGIVDHEAGTRDMRRLRGLGRRLPVLAAVGMTAMDVRVAHADGIERQRPAPRPRARPAPPPVVIPPPAPIYRESAPIPLAPPAPVVDDRYVTLSDGFFSAPLAGGVGYDINSAGMGGGSLRVVFGSTRHVTRVTHRSSHVVRGVSLGGSCN